MWATPAAADSVGTTGGGQGRSLRTDVKMWPTPDTRGFTNQGSLEMLSKKAATKEEFDGMAYRKSKVFKGKMWATPTESEGKPHSSGSLNPAWVEWLMGYPSGWTDLGG